MTQFLQEAMRMRSFSHNHVLTMMGIVDLDGRPYVVLPYMANGDLKTHLLDDKQVTVTPAFHLTQCPLRNSAVILNY